MSDNASNQRAPGIVWLLGVLASFAVLAMVFNALFSGERTDPRAADRLKNKEDIAKEQTANVQKLALVPGPASKDTLDKGLALVKSQPPVVSKMVVPGSKTQLQQAAAAAPAAPAAGAPPATAPAAPATAPAPAK